MSVLISIIIALILGFLKDLYYTKKKQEIDERIKKQKDAVNEVMQDFDKSYSDFRIKLDQYNREKSMRATSGPVQSDSGEKSSSDRGTEKTDRDPGSKD